MNSIRTSVTPSRCASPPPCRRPMPTIGPSVTAAGGASRVSKEDGHGSYNASGRRLGTVEQGPGGYVLRDGSGRRTGTVETGPGGYVQRDTSGRRTGAVEQDTTGQWIMRDTAGRRVGTISALAVVNTASATTQGKATTDKSCQ